MPVASHTPAAGARGGLARLQIVAGLTLAAMAACAHASAVQSVPDLRLPLRADSVRFAVIGDGGTGDSGQRQVGERMAMYHAAFPFEFVIMLGDNMYGDEEPDDFVEKFEEPYKELLDAGVKFYAAIGNHDLPEVQRYYEPFNMGGERYYTHTQRHVEFFVLDSVYMSPQQLEWLEGALDASTAPWKIAYFHHPLYSSGARHGSEEDLRELLEPLFIEHGVNAVFAGHEHFYERLEPQNGIYYFTSGAAGKLRLGNIRRGERTAAGFDTDLHFMLVEIAGDEMFFQTVTRRGWTVDAGVVRRQASAVTQ